MAKKILLGVLGVVVGLFVGMAFNMALVMANVGLHGPPEGMDWNDAAKVKAFVAGMPFLGFLIVLVAHSGQAFFGALVGTLIAGRRHLIVAWIIGALTLLGCVLNLMSIPSPVWFAVFDVLLPLPAAWLGGRLVLKKGD